jgi:hypothetical protein
VLYTAPAYDSNVTTPSATAIIKEILLANTTASPATVTLGINGTAAANQFIPTVTVAANDTKLISGMDTMLSGTDTLNGLQGTSGAITVTISGVEIQ